MSFETVDKALKELTAEMKADPEFAWCWHRMIAKVATDAGAPHEEANDRTAHFMRYVFDVETTEPPSVKKQNCNLIKVYYDD